MSGEHNESAPEEGRPSGDVTILLDRAREGGSEALEALVLRVYSELRRAAAHLVGREGPDFTLMATDVVHEAFLRLFGKQQLDWQNRRHFFGSAATAMRRVLIDHARRKDAGKRIPKGVQVTLGSAESSFEVQDFDLVTLGHALDRLAQDNPRQAEIVEMQFFAGLRQAEIAEILGLSRATVNRDWQVARLRLLREMES